MRVSLFISLINGFIYEARAKSESCVGGEVLLFLCIRVAIFFVVQCWKTYMLRSMCCVRCALLAYGWWYAHEEVIHGFGCFIFVCSTQKLYCAKYCS